MDPAPVQSRDEADLLRELLASRDIPCPVCSYNLRGLDRPVCPECAAPLRLHLTSSNLRLGPWLLGVISLALALGFDGVVSLLLSFGLILSPPKSPAAFQIFLTFLGGFILLVAVAGAGIWALVAKRPAWNRLPLRRQWAFGSSIFLVTFLSHALFGAIIARIL
jgi:hypothetical protein